MIALLPQGALIDSRQDSTLAVRAIANPEETLSMTINNNGWHDYLTRQVVMVTTSDRLQIPPIAHFCQLVKKSTLNTATMESKQLVN